MAKVQAAASGIGQSVQPYISADNDFTAFDNDLNKLKTATTNIANNFVKYNLIGGSQNVTEISKLFRFFTLNICQSVKSCDAFCK